MIKNFLPLGLCLFVVADVLGQSPGKRVQQPPEVVEAYRVCNEFQRLLAQDIDFASAFEATFTKDPVKRRAIAIAESELGSNLDVSEVDDATLIAIYKTQWQFILLIAPLLYVVEGDDQPVVFPPQIEELLQHPRPQEAKSIQSYLVQLKQDLAILRAHFDKLAATNPFVADKIRDFKRGLKEPLEPPNHVVKPLTAYSHGHVLPLDAEYYQIGDYFVIREAGQMRIIRFRFFSIRW
jgi:hypothetical protein